MTQPLNYEVTTFDDCKLVEMADAQWGLTWNYVGSNLERLHLLGLNQLLTKAVLDLNFCNAAEGDYYLEQSQAGKFRLYLQTISLEMNLLEFLTLAKRVRQAAQSKSYI